MVSTHCRSGTGANSSSTHHEDTSTIRRPPDDAQIARPLHKKAASTSSRQVPQWKRAKPLASFRPARALFRDLGVHRRARLCGVLRYASAQALDFLDLAED